MLKALAVVVGARCFGLGGLCVVTRRVQGCAEPQRRSVGCSCALGGGQRGSNTGAEQNASGSSATFTCRGGDAVGREEATGLSLQWWGRGRRARGRNWVQKRGAVCLGTVPGVAVMCRGDGNGVTGGDTIRIGSV